MGDFKLKGRLRDFILEILDIKVFLGVNFLVVFIKGINMMFGLNNCLWVLDFRLDDKGEFI